MNRKDYEVIAKIIRDLDMSPDTLDMRADIARAFASELMNTNPKFNMPKFLAACQIKETAK